MLAPLRSSPLVRYLGVHMPAGVLTVLAVYAVTALPGPLVTLAAALAVTTGLQLWRRNLAVSMVAGTIVYVVMVSGSGPYRFDMDVPVRAAPSLAEFLSVFETAWAFGPAPSRSSIVVFERSHTLGAYRADRLVGTTLDFDMALTHHGGG